MGQEEGEGAVSGLVGTAGGEGAALDASGGQEEGEGAGASLKRAREGQQEEQLVAEQGGAREQVEGGGGDCSWPSSCGIISPSSSLAQEL